MKEYNIKAIVDKDELKLIFECDKEKNNKCKKNNCDICNHTTDSRYMKAKARQHDKTITDKQIIINLEKEIEYYRNKIGLLEKTNKEQRQYIINNKIKSNNNEEVDYDIKEIITTNIYADRKVIETITQYRYNEEAEQSTCPKIEIGMHMPG